MLLSESHKFLFIHIPKNAGTSIQKQLRPYASPTQKRYPVKLLTKLHLVPDWHWRHFSMHAPLYEAERYLPKELYDSLFKFAVVRNPWDRMVSFYHYYQQNRGYRWRRVRMRMQDGFSDFLRYAADKNRSVPIKFRQVPMIADASGTIGVDHILRTETLDSDWQQLLETLGLKVELDHVNKSRRPSDYRSMYSDDDAQFVAEHWREDIEAFGYSFD